MLYRSILFYFILSIASCSADNASHSFFTAEKRDTIAKQAQSWIDTAVAPLSHEEVQIVANAVYLTYASSLLDCNTRRCVAIFLTATLQLSHDVDNTYDTARYQMIGVLSRNLETLVSTREFINAAWSACRGYIESDAFVGAHRAVADAIEQFRDLVEEVTTQYLEASVDEVKQEMRSTNASIDIFIRDVTAGKARVYTNMDAFNTLEQLLGSAKVLQETGSQAFILGVSLDHQSADLLDAVKQTSIVYYKQLYTWMNAQQIPQQYMMCMFDRNGIMAVEQRTEPLQDPAHLSYYF